jgi:hypothetical protein
MYLGVLCLSTAGSKQKLRETMHIRHGATIKRIGNSILLRILKTNSSCDNREDIRQKKIGNCEDDERQHECP